MLRFCDPIVGASGSGKPLNTARASYGVWWVNGSSNALERH